MMKRGNSGIAFSCFQSPPKKNHEYQYFKHSPSAVGSCRLEEESKRSEGQAHDMHHMVTVRRRDQWRETHTKNADNIEIPAKDNNITGGNS